VAATACRCPLGSVDGEGVHRFVFHACGWISHQQEIRLNRCSAGVATFVARGACFTKKCPWPRSCLQTTRDHAAC
jgi:hypothetical protein